MAVQIPFNRESDFVAGRLDTLGANLRRVTAPNPGPFTFFGTNTYIVGRGEVAIVDPGPKSDAHLQALLAAVQGETVTHILVTHTHSDHSPLAAPLKAATGAQVLGYGPPDAPVLSVNPIAIEEPTDNTFRPDTALRDGDVVEGAGWRLACVHTPGHMSNHLCYALEESNALLTGDHVMAWSTSVIVPPDGDMAAYMASLDKVLRGNYATLWPAHGGPVGQPTPFLRAFIAHRDERERAILEGLRAGVVTIPALVERIYVDVDRRLHIPAQLSVLAHMIRMVADKRVRADGPPSLEARYEAAS